MNYGFIKKYREITNLIKDNRNARDIFDYLCSAAAWGKYTDEINGQRIFFRNRAINFKTKKDRRRTLAWHENRKKCSYSDQEIKSALNF